MSKTSLFALILIAFAGAVSGQTPVEPAFFMQATDIATGLSEDTNTNGVPDECDGCGADVDGSGVVNVLDLVAVTVAWGVCPGEPDPCPADIDGNGIVDVFDLVEVIVSWGLTCPDP